MCLMCTVLNVCCIICGPLGHTISPHYFPSPVLRATTLARIWPRVHSSVVREADCRSAGPWFKSGCALFMCSICSNCVVCATTLAKIWPRAHSLVVRAADYLCVQYVSIVSSVSDVHNVFNVSNVFKCVCIMCGPLSHNVFPAMF